MEAHGERGGNRAPEASTLNFTLVSVCDKVMNEYRQTREPIAWIIYKHAQKAGLSTTEIARALQKRKATKGKHEARG